MQDTTTEGKACGMSDKSCGTKECAEANCQGAAWWATLVVAVLAVPSFGSIIASMFPFRGIGTILIFILACWACTYLGMKLMKDPRMQEKVDLSTKKES
jgi:hypothetical protein